MTGLLRIVQRGPVKKKSTTRELGCFVMQICTEITSRNLSQRFKTNHCGQSSYHNKAIIFKFWLNRLFVGISSSQLCWFTEYEE